MDATVTVLDVGVPVDFYLYDHTSGETTKCTNGMFETQLVDAVACVPRNAEFPMNLQGKKWSKAAKTIGAVALFRSIKEGGGKKKSAAAAPAPPPETIQEEDDENDETTLAAVPTPTLAPVPQQQQQEQTNVQVLAPRVPTPPSILAPVIQQPVPETAVVSSYSSAAETPIPPGGACYLVYEPDSSGRLVEHYSKTPVDGAIGLWIISKGSKNKIAGFKFKQNLGRSVLIGNCSAGVQGRKNYCSGWCQFVRSARVMEADVMLWDPVGKGMMVDVYLYRDDPRPTHQTCKLETGVAYTTKKLLAVTCIPKNTPFFENMAVDILKWLADGSSYGASSRF